MRKINLSVIVLLCIYLLFSGCSDEKEELLPPESPASTVDNLKIKEIIQAFESNVNSGKNELRSSAIEETLDIEEIKQETFLVNPGNQLRSSSGMPASSVNVCTVRFVKNEKRGFAIVSDDERLQKVYVYSENGLLSDTVFNVGLAESIEEVRSVIESDIRDYYSVSLRSSSRRPSGGGDSEVIRRTSGPLLKTEWHQTLPYNKKMPVGCPEHGNHKPAGCVAIALAQVIAYMDPSSYVPNRYSLSAIRELKEIDQNNKYAGAVSELVFDIAEGINTNYDCKGSGAKLWDASDYLTEKWCIKNTHTLFPIIYWDQVSRCLRCKHPVIVGGFRDGDNVGHAWVIDGYSNDNDNGDIYVHCNWGSGTGNAWVLKKDYALANPYEEPYSKKSQIIYIEGFETGPSIPVERPGSNTRP